MAIAAFGMIGARANRAWADTLTTVDFDDLQSGIYSNLQQPYGITFEAPGIEVFACDSACGGAYTNPNVARSGLVTEFRRSDFAFDFSGGQNSISLYTRSDEAPSTDTISAQLCASGDDNIAIGCATRTFTKAAPWQNLTVTDPSSLYGIKHVVLRGTDAFGNVTNFLRVDHIVAKGNAAAPPPPDTRAPTVVIDSPASNTDQSTPYIASEVHATDDVGVNAVTGWVVENTTQDVVSPVFTYCPTATSGGACGTTASGVFDPTNTGPMYGEFRLPTASAGYTLVVRACDFSDNCSETFSHVNLHYLPQTPVRARYIELNQAVQRSLNDLPQIGDFSRIFSATRILAGKDLLVRIYAFGEGGSQADYSASLNVTLHASDGSVQGRFFLPNTVDATGAVQSSVGVAPFDGPAGSDTALPSTLIAMRADPTRTLNYVIPASFLSSDGLLDLSVLGASGDVQVGLSPRTRLGLNLVQIDCGTSCIGVGTPRLDDVEHTIVPYLQHAYPVSDVAIVSRRHMYESYDGPAEGIDMCDSLYDLWTAYGTDDAPVQHYSSDPTWLPTVGYLNADGLDPHASGCAYIDGTWTGFAPFATPTPQRVGGVAITEQYGDIAAQEIAHTMGLNHAGNSHDENSGCTGFLGFGPPCYEPWPEPHGLVGINDFGVTLNAQTPPSGNNTGQWTVRVIDPCPNGDPTTRATWDHCQLTDADGNGVHDFMSYGYTYPPTPVPFTTSQGNGDWASSTTYNRIYDAIAYGTPTPAAAVTGTADRFVASTSVDSFAIGAVIAPDGQVRFLPAVRKVASADRAYDPGAGPAEVRLLDGTGNVLFSRSTTTGVLTHKHGYAAIFELVPYFPNLARIEIRANDQVIGHEDVSAHPPTVHVILPNGGEVFANGDHTVTWSVNDADGDPVTSYVQYSADRGQHWDTIGVAHPGVTSMSLTASDFPSGTEGLVRVVASDGLLTSSDSSDCPFGLGTDTATPCQTDLSIDESASPDPAVAGQSVTYTATVHNDGPDVAHTAEMVDTLPSTVQYESATADGSNCSATDGTVDCTFEEIAAGDARTIIITALVSPNVVYQGGLNARIVNTASVASLNGIDTNTTNNHATIATPVELMCQGNVVTIVGTLGNDTINGSGGRDVIDGGPGNDTITGGGGNDIICGGAGDDVIHGGAGNNYITGDGGNDTIYGDAGDDALFGNAGNDLLRGGDGNDTMLGGAGDDKMLGDAGYANAIAFYDSPQGVTVDLATGTASGFGRDRFGNIQNVVGSELDDTLLGDSSDNIMNGLEGNDTIDGRAGTDTIEYDWIYDPVNINLDAGIATGQGTDQLANIENAIGTPRDDTLIGNSSTNILIGEDGNDVIRGGRGADTLQGDAGDDQLFGDAGNDILKGGSGTDIGDGGAGRNTCTDIETPTNC